MINVFLDVKPTPKGRPRFANGRVYTPKETKDAEKEIAVLVANHMLASRLKMVETAVVIEIIFYFALPKKVTQEEKMLCDIGMLYHSCRPDIDNLAKLVIDAIIGIALKDDGQVCKLVCEKKYAKSEGILLKMMEI